MCRFEHIQNMGKNKSTFPNLRTFSQTWCEKVPLLTVTVTAGGPLQIITWVITPISRVITPVKPIYKATYWGYTPLITGSGAHLTAPCRIPQEWHARLRENDSSAPLDVRGENTGGEGSCQMCGLYIYMGFNMLYGIQYAPRWMEVGESLSKMVG